MPKPDLTKMGYFDRTIEPCTVSSIPAGDVPKFIKVKLPGPDEPIIDAWWTGIPDLEEDQSVSIRRSDGNLAQYSISGGGSGTAPPSAHTHPATEVTADTTNFDGNLSALDNTVQKALETLDELNATAWPFSNTVYATTEAELNAAITAATAGQTTIIIDCDIQLTADIEIDKAISIVGFSGGYSIPSIKGPVAGGRCFTVSDTGAGAVSFSNLTMETIESDILFASNSSLFLENCTLRFIGPVTGDVGGIAALVDNTRLADIQIKVFNSRFLNVDPGDSFGYGLWLVNTDTGYGPDALTAEVHHSAFAVISSDIEAEECTIKLYDPVLPNGINETGCVVTGSWMDGDGNRLPQSFIGDIFLAGDEAGVKQRGADVFTTSITDHFDGIFSGYTWAAYAGFVTPGGVDVSTYPSIVALHLTGVQPVPSRAFAYKTAGTSIAARCHPTANSRAGIRVDDGTNNNYVELFLEHNTTTHEMDLKYRTASGGVVTGPTTLWTAPIQWVVLSMNNFGTSPNISQLLRYQIDGATNLFMLGSPNTFIPARIGLYYEQVSSVVSSGRAALFDWMKQ